MISKIPIICRQGDITITKDFLMASGRDWETIPINQVSEITMTSRVVKDYRAGAILLLIIGIFTISFGIGFLFIALGIGAWYSKVYQYSLYVTVKEKRIWLLNHRRSGPLKSIVRTLHGLNLSMRLHSFDPTESVRAL